MPRFTHQDTAPPLFIYGTLLVPEVMRAVLGREIKPVPAALRGYRRLLVRGALHCGILPDPDSRVTGAVIDGLTSEDLAALDYFEEGMYERRRVEVKLESGRVTEAETFVVRPSHRHLLTRQPWDLETFRRDHLDAFLDR